MSHGPALLAKYFVRCSTLCPEKRREEFHQPIGLIKQTTLHGQAVIACRIGYGVLDDLLLLALTLHHFHGEKLVCPTLIVEKEGRSNLRLGGESVIDSLAFSR
jgi:hypothetical protein